MQTKEIIIFGGQRINRDLDSYEALITASFPKSWHDHNVEVCRTVDSDPRRSDKCLVFCLGYKGEVFATIRIIRRRLRAYAEDVIEEAYLKYHPDDTDKEAFARIDRLRIEQAETAERSKIIYDFVRKEFNVDAQTARQYLSETWPYMPK